MFNSLGRIELISPTQFFISVTLGIFWKQLPWKLCLFGLPFQSNFDFSGVKYAVHS